MCDNLAFVLYSNESPDRPAAQNCVMPVRGRWELTYSLGKGPGGCMRESGTCEEDDGCSVRFEPGLISLIS